MGDGRWAGRVADVGVWVVIGLLIALAVRFFVGLLPITHSPLPITSLSNPPAVMHRQPPPQDPGASRKSAPGFHDLALTLSHRMGEGETFGACAPCAAAAGIDPAESDLGEAAAAAKILDGPAGRRIPDVANRWEWAVCPQPRRPGRLALHGGAAEAAGQGRPAQSNEPPHPGPLPRWGRGSA